MPLPARYNYSQYLLSLSGESRAAQVSLGAGFYACPGCVFGGKGCLICATVYLR